MLLEPKFLVTCAKMFIDLASHLNLRLRALGGIAVRMHCPHIEANGFSRPLLRNDIDFVADASQISSIEDMMLNSRCTRTATHNYRGGEHRQYEYQSEQGISLTLDIYFGLLRFNHDIPEPYFSEEGPYTIPITQLLISKLAIVEMREVDMLDVAAILSEHPVGRKDETETIQFRPLLRSWCSGCSGWGLSKTCVTNIKSIEEHLKDPKFASNPVVPIVEERLRDLEDLTSKCPKSTCWRTRSALDSSFLGSRIQWYRAVQPGEEDGML